jgi:membrane protease YdiL (CAAX protease family)
MQTSYARREALLGSIFPFAALALLNGFYKQPLYLAGPAWYWLADVVQFVLVPALCAWFLLRPAGIDARALGLGPDRHATRVSLQSVLFVAVCLVLVSWPVLRVCHAVAAKYADDLPSVLPVAWGPRLLVATYMAATAAIAEELVFRALPWLYLREVLSARWRTPVYLLTTTVVFALIHSEQGPGGMVGAAWFGLLAAVFYRKLGSLWPPVLAHFALDMIFLGPW